MNRARLGRYAAWQLRDFFLERALAIVIVLGFLVWFTGHTLMASAPRTHEGRMAMTAVLLAAVVRQSWFLVAIVAVNGISAHDRATGRFRFLFAKPLAVAAYYAQAFAVNGAGLLLCAALAFVALMTRGAFDAALLGRALAIVAAAYLCVGGIGFFFSALWRFDWGLTAATVLLTVLSGEHYPNAGWLVFLPPVHHVPGQAARLAAGQALEAAPLAALAAYGLLCFALGLLVLRRRPLAT